MIGNPNGLVSRYARRHPRRGRVGWHDGPYNAIDRLISLDYSASEIAAELDVPRWLVVERFASRGALASTERNGVIT